jgi:restriction endonuclease S subunit
MKTKVGDIAKIQFGQHSKQPQESGEVAYLQARHFDEQGRQSLEIDSFLPEAEQGNFQLLQDGDVLLVGKGNRNFAWTYYDSFGPAAASSIFFVIRPDKDKVIPEYLTTYFNLPKVQAQFQILAAGSNIPSIRKSELEAFTLQLPSLDAQLRTVKLKQLHLKEMELSFKLIAEKQKMYQAAISQMIG